MTGCMHINNRMLRPFSSLPQCVRFEHQCRASVCSSLHSRTPPVVCFTPGYKTSSPSPHCQLLSYVTSLKQGHVVKSTDCIRKSRVSLPHCRRVISIQDFCVCLYARMFTRSNNIRYILSLVPGKRLGTYRFLPIFFCIGGVMEWIMINVRIGQETFYDVYRRKQSERGYQQKIADGLIAPNEPAAK